MRFIDALHTMAGHGFLTHAADCDVRTKPELHPDRRTPCTCGFEELVRQLQTDAAARELKLQRALEPFAQFAEKFEAKPLRGLDDALYAIHSGEDGAQLKLSDCKQARATLKDLGLD